jgi:hypothetical protein
MVVIAKHIFEYDTEYAASYAADLDKFIRGVTNQISG